MQRTEYPLLSPSLGSHKTLVAFHFGVKGARPKVYIQASLHAEELPGMLVAHHLRERLEAAEQSGHLRGEVILVPAANPVGLAQRLNHRAMGRFEFDTAQNFNRHYPDMAAAVVEDALPLMGTDARANVETVRRLVGQWLTQWQPATELESLRRQLLLLSHDADLVLDLHCDTDAVMHLYSEEACWPPFEPLARLLGCRAVLLARESGGGPFDERLSGLWWQLAAALKDAGVNAPLPQACASTTVELRGEADVSHGLARQDAQAIEAYLAHVGALGGAISTPLPPMACEPTPLAGSQTLRSPVPGVLVFLARPGDSVSVGDVVAEVIDPTAAPARVHAVRAEVAGVLYAAVRERYLVAGGEVGKIAGATPFRSGDLLGA
ncbi:MAG: succinylglutamate desuccinylase/aspartoacylase family protein [Hydrogenophaga sp.]|jgi:predicted deacylase|uniref:M14 family metallopeptidase n=1 Tax=Hydrogenophaga sp. TaxID=1904254 RepID=UPI001D4269A9|nr:M14 family metallopeptidase [Hydrogenophaga sp.]MBW0172097.1 succinylglutamate desuccinylase/aspartoacylase family protein [Hydrogenophaga sp.]MBW0182839.1 succinylglutamate desuccinylase/aspartoacylase family protein [Hydrogenophaga sp.]